LIYKLYKNKIVSFVFSAVQCSSLTAPDNGSLGPQQDAYDVSQVVTFTCNRGYALNGARQVTCLVSGQWSDVEPTCAGKILDPDVCENKNKFSEGTINSTSFGFI